MSRKVSTAELVGFRIVGDAATPLGTGILVRSASLSIMDVEIIARGQRRNRFRAAARSALIGSDIHDNPGAAMVIRAGTAPRIAHNAFLRNGMSERARAPFTIEAGGRPRFHPTYSQGLLLTRSSHFGPGTAALVQDNWFLGIHEPPPPAPSHAGPAHGRARRWRRSSTGSVRTRSSRRSAVAGWPPSSLRPTRARAVRSLSGWSRHARRRRYLDAEKWGAELQEQFCRVSSLVPKFYEHGILGRLLLRRHGVSGRRKPF